jgi:alpha-ribazole phosphatase
LFLVRHGNTSLDSAMRFWGKTDVALSLDGIRQAEKLRDRLVRQKFHAAYSSRLSRARATAEIISGGSLDITSLAELDEINFGWVEGLTFEEIKKRHPEMAETMGNWKIRQKFPGGESLDELNDRLQKFLERLQKHQPEETVLIVAHAGTLRVLICNLLGIGLEHWRQMQIDLASLSIVETYPQGAILSLLNDVSHLGDRR